MDAASRHTVAGDGDLVSDGVLRRRKAPFRESPQPADQPEDELENGKDKEDVTWGRTPSGAGKSSRHGIDSAVGHTAAARQSRGRVDQDSDSLPCTVNPFLPSHPTHHFPSFLSHSTHPLLPPSPARHLFPPAATPHRPLPLLPLLLRSVERLL